MSRLDFRRELSQWLEEQCGLDSSVFGERALEDVIQQRTMSRKTNDRADYARLWRADAAERQSLLDGLLVGETWFFREWSSFARFDEWVRARRNQFSQTTPLQVLSLPCATGEEAWSIAALLREAGFREGEALIEAIDISQPALEQARLGVYPARRLRMKNSQRWSHLLEPGENSLLRVADCLKGLVRFRQGNAMDRSFPGRNKNYHVIFCRNMLIYMSPQARSHVFRTLYDLLNPQGLLFLGHTESAPPDSGFRRSEGTGAFAWERDSDQPSSRPRPGYQPSPPPKKTLVRLASPVLPLSSEPLVPHNPAGEAPSPLPSNQTPSLPVAPPLSDKLQQARQLANRGDYSEALSWLESPEGRSSLDVEVHCLAGILLSALKNGKEATVRLKRALYLKPDHTESLIHLALLLEQQGDTGNASRLRSRLQPRDQATP